MLKVYGRTSSINVRKVLWLCTELGLPVEQEPWGTGFRSTQEMQFLAMNPNGLVPVIDDAGFVLWESNTICRYLAARHGRTDLLPRDGQARARVEQWMDWQATELNNAWRYAFMHWARRSPSFADPAAAAASAEHWNRHMALLDAQLACSGGFVTGSDFTLADIVLGLATHRWLMTPIERPALPAVDAYCMRLRERPGFDALASADMP